MTNLGNATSPGGGTSCGCQSAPCQRPGEPLRLAMAPGTLSSEMTWRDRLGTLRVRLGIGRMNYRVRPGLYALGRPTAEAPVLVSANFKLSVDHLRSAVRGLDAWILVLDTHGINVWCAAGKGLFGTDEVVRQVESVGLSARVSHRKLVLPQLAAPGVAAHEVKRRTGFRVVYGPVRAADIPAFLAARMTATDEMRQVRYGWRDRAILIPVEVITGAKYPSSRPLPSPCSPSSPRAAPQSLDRSPSARPQRGSHSSRFLRAARSARCSCRGCPGVPSP